MDVDAILSQCNEISKVPLEDVCRIGEDVPIPIFCQEELLSVYKKAQWYFEQQPVLLNLNGEYTVVGDLHGNLHDLFRIFHRFGFPPYRKYIFLGDYVDRGEFSIECITLLFALMLKYPDCVYLLRGNHEFKEVNKHYGLYEQIMKKYNNESLYELLNEAFAYMPLACILNQHFFIVHAGIEHGNSKTLEKIQNVQRPITTYSGSFIADILWSDPTEKQTLSGAENARGVGHYYSEATVSQFLKKNSLGAIIRGHQCTNGTMAMHKGKTLTLFSSSGYSQKNIGSALLIQSDKITEVYSFNPIKYPTKDEVYYYYPKPAVQKQKMTSFNPLPRLSHQNSLSSSRRFRSTSQILFIRSAYSVPSELHQSA